MPSNNGTGTNARMNRISKKMTERLTEIVERRREAQGDEPLGAYRPLRRAERQRLFAEWEEGDAWERLKQTFGQRAVYDFAKETLKGMRKELEDAT